MRRLAPIFLLNVVVVLIVAVVVVQRPEYFRMAALVMPVLLVLNYLFIRAQKKKRAEEIATGKATPASPDTMKTAMCILALYGAASYVSGAFNIPELLHHREFGMWLGWTVKMVIGTGCLWSAYKVRKSLRKRGNDAQQQMP